MCFGSHAQIFKVWRIGDENTVLLLMGQTFDTSLIRFSFSLELSQVVQDFVHQQLSLASTKTPTFFYLGVPVYPSFCEKGC